MRSLRHRLRRVVQVAKRARRANTDAFKTRRCRRVPAQLSVALHWLRRARDVAPQQNFVRGPKSSHTGSFFRYSVTTRSRSAHFAAPGSPLVSAAPASSCAAQSTSYSRHAGSKQRGDDSDGTSCTLLCKRTTLQSTLYVLRAQATTSPCHQARSRPAPPPAPPRPRWHAKHRLLLRSVLVPLLAAGPQGNLQTAPRRFPSHQLLAACSMAYLFGLKTES